MPTVWAQLGTKDKQALHRHPKSFSPLPGASQTLALQPLSIADSLIAVAFPCQREGAKPQNGRHDSAMATKETLSSALLLPSWYLNRTPAHPSSMGVSMKQQPWWKTGLC